MKYFVIGLITIFMMNFSLIINAQENGNKKEYDEKTNVLKEKIKKAGTAKDYPGYNTIIVLSKKEVFVDESGYNLTTETNVTKILNENVIKSFRVLVFGYNPNTNYIQPKIIRIHKKNGDTINVDTKNILDRPGAEGIIIWGGKTKSIALPAIEVDDAIEIVSVRKGFNIAYLNDDDDINYNTSIDPISKDTDKDKFLPPMVGHYHTYEIFSSSTPIMEKIFVVHMPKTKILQYKVYNGELESAQYFNDKYITHVWKKKNIKPFKREANMVSYYNVANKVVLSTLPNWEERSKWFYKVNEPSFEVDEKIKKKVNELIKDAKNDDEKIAILTHWVADYVRYLGLNMGKGEGYTTHPAKMTFYERGGVCKDKAGVLVAMLRAAGFESYIVMTNAMTKVEKIPADQFNHAVTCIRRKDGTFQLLDPTWVPNSPELWSSLEQLQHVVIGTKEGQGLSRAPYTEPDDNQLCMSADAQIDADGNLKGTINLVAYGYPDSRFRRVLGNAPSFNKDDLFYKLITTISPQAELDNYTCSDNYDYTKPMKMKFYYKVDNYAFGGKTKYFALPIASNFEPYALLPRFLSINNVEKRNYDIRILNTLKYCYKSTIELPKGYKIEKIPDKIKIDTKNASFQFTCGMKDGKFVSVGLLRIKNIFVKTNEYEDLKKVIESIQKIKKLRLKLVRIKKKTEK